MWKARTSKTTLEELENWDAGKEERQRQFEDHVRRSRLKHALWCMVYLASFFAFFMLQGTPHAQLAILNGIIVSILFWGRLIMLAFIGDVLPERVLYWF